jgi:hypothetical protein
MKFTVPEFSEEIPRLQLSFLEPEERWPEFVMSAPSPCVSLLINPGSSADRVGSRRNGGHLQGARC